jgi:hypothetical protein
VVAIKVWELPERASPGTQKHPGSNLQRNLRYNTCGCQVDSGVKSEVSCWKTKISGRKTGENR